jgi:glucose/arabinose dehydrogenase
MKSPRRWRAMRAWVVLSMLVLGAGCLAGPTEDPVAPRTPANELTGIGLQVVATDLRSPLYALVVPGTRDLAIVEQTGQVWRLHNGSIDPQPFLDMAGRAGAGNGEQGLLGLAFHPEFQAKGVAVVSYTDGSGDSVLSRVHRADDGSRLDASTEEVLLRVDQPFANHNGGHILYGPDGYLYYGLGDGGLAGDPNLNGQNPRTLLGSILRLEVGPTGPYAVPPDNPYADGSEGAPEVWATGLRNPWRFHFDGATGDLWIADVGQNMYEEVNRQPAGVGGLNYGWNLFEGWHHFPVDVAAAPVFESLGFTFPVAEYSHESGCSVTGGPVYRGAALPWLQGHALYGDFCSGTIWSLSVAGGEPTVLLDEALTVSSFGLDWDGEVLVLDYAAGRLLRLVPA